MTTDAVMVGGGTARADRPSLTVRGMGDVPQPVRVVLTRRLDLPDDGPLAETAAEVPVWLIHGSDATKDNRAIWQDRGARLIEVPVARGGQLDVDATLQALGQAGLTRVFCEGGGMLAAALLAAGLVDELINFSAGLALGAEGRPAIGPLGVDALPDAPRFELAEAREIGPDIMVRWVRRD